MGTYQGFPRNSYPRNRKEFLHSSFFPISEDFQIPMMSLVPPLLVAALAPQPGVVRGCLSDGRAHRSALHLALPFDPPSPRAMRPTRLHPHERRPLLTRTRPLTSLAPRLWRGLITLGTAFAIQRPLAALAHGAMISGAPSKPLSQSAMISRFVVWFVMFATAALLAGGP